jgi:hypothetical protein
MRERRRRHDDAHHPMGGKRGRRAYHGASASRSAGDRNRPRLVPWTPTPPEKRCKVCNLDEADHQPSGWIRHDFRPLIEGSKNDE